jgi:hypothetical protein
MQAEMRKALLVDDNGADRSLLVKRLRTLGFSCYFAHSFYEAKTQLTTEVFEVVLSRISIKGGTAYELRPLLLGRPSSLFYSLAVEQDCWWIPGVRRGKECLGEPALRPEDFFRALAPVAAGSVG